MLRFSPATAIVWLAIAGVVGGCGSAQTGKGSSQTVNSSCGHLYTLVVGKQTIPLGDCAEGVGPPYTLDVQLHERFSVRTATEINGTPDGPTLAVKGDAVAQVAQSGNTATYEAFRGGTAKLVDHHPYCEHTRKPSVRRGRGSGALIPANRTGGKPAAALGTQPRLSDEHLLSRAVRNGPPSRALDCASATRALRDSPISA